jgi:hypothetical protein
VTDLDRARRFFVDQVRLPLLETTNFVAQIGPARGAWFKDPDGNVFGVREGPVPGIGPG